MQAITPTLEITESFPTSPSGPRAVHHYVSAMMGLPCNYHRHSLRTYSIRGAEYLDKYKDRIQNIWSYSSQNTTTRLSAILKHEDIIYFVDDTEPDVAFWYKSPPEDAKPKIEALIAELETFCIELPPEPAIPVAKISLLLTDMSGSLSEIRKRMNTWVRKPKEELELLYDYSKFEDLVDFMQYDSGIAILQGESGTGKTSLIRDAISAVALEPDPTEIVYLTAENLRAIGSEQFVNYFIRNSNRCLVCEDSEPVLQKTTNGVRSPSTANLLNLGDGILGDISQMSVVATLNCDMEKVDPALVRPGRCKLLWKVERHTEDQIYKYWEYKHGVDPSSFKEPQKNTGPITLAEFHQLASIIK